METGEATLYSQIIGPLVQVGRFGFKDDRDIKLEGS